jgi:hypothetical protein
MTISFDAVEELRNNGLAGNEISPATEQILGALSPSQVKFLVKTQQQISAGEPEGESLPLAVTKAMGWARPAATAVDAEVEGMEEGNCLCACTGGGGGGGA